MNTLLLYTVKVAVYIIAFYLVYFFMLSRDTSYGRNRAFILLSLAASLLLPLISFQTLKAYDIQFFGKFLSEVFITASSEADKTINPGLSAANPIQIIWSVYLTGVFTFTLKLVADLINLLFLIVRKKNGGNRIIRFHGFNTSGFSAMGHIFINSNLNSEEADNIIKHEQNHLRQNHFLDILFIEILKVLQWFNPVIHLFNRSLRAVHEFQADHGCLCSGVPVVSYQSLLLRQVFRSGAFNLTNSFSNPSLIKKRMIMMTKKRTSSLANMKLLFVIPVIAFLIMAISVRVADSTPYENNPENALPPPPPPPPKTEEVSDKSEIEPFEVVEEMPKFPGGDTELIRYIGENTTYPVAAKENNIQGRVIIRFCITEKGGIDRISILKGVDPELDAEALRVVKSLPSFEPGKQGGSPVPVWYMIPITFTLK